MLNHVLKLKELFDKLKSDRIAYLFIDDNGINYRQSGAVILVGQIHYDCKCSGFLVIKDIIKNKEVLSKLIQYQIDEYLVTQIKTKLGFYYQVYDNFGKLVYCNQIKFTSYTSWFINRFFSKRYPGLRLKEKILNV